MKLVLSFFILLILILGIIFLKVKITLEDVDFKLIRKNIQTAKYKLKISLYFLGFIKIASIKIIDGNVKIFFFQKRLEELKNTKLYLEIIKPRLEILSKEEVVKDLKNVNFKLENMKLNLEFGTDSVLITSVLVGILSAIITISMQIYIEKFKKENYYWKITPNFKETLFVNLNASLKLSYSPILSKIAKNV